MNMLKQLNDAIAYIEKNLHQEIDLDQAAAAACVSRDSFVRFFSYMTGMTINEYIRRRRLTQAGYELQNTEQRVLDIAVKYGYDSADAFAKAFARQHGMTPTQARRQHAALRVYSPVSFHIYIKGAKEMNYRMVEVNEKQVWGIARKAEVKASERFELEHIMWAAEEDFVPRQICDGFDGVWYGIWNQGEYAIAREKENVTGENLEMRVIPAGAYAAFTTERGVYAGDALPELRAQIFESWLPNSEYRQKEDFELEVYHLCTDRARRQRERYFEIWVPVEKK